jgi:hypothetical protein
VRIFLPRLASFFKMIAETKLFLEYFIWNFKSIMARAKQKTIALV